ncbi:MAG: hypothetical protein QM767_14355 [Anaeromyxobacter sp.]
MRFTGGLRSDTILAVCSTAIGTNFGESAGRGALDQSLIDRCGIEHEGRRLELHPVDPVANARRKRLPRRPGEAPATSTDFDPTQTLLDAATGRRRKENDR